MTILRFPAERAAREPGPMDGLCFEASSFAATMDPGSPLRGVRGACEGDRDDA